MLHFHMHVDFWAAAAAGAVEEAAGLADNSLIGRFLPTQRLSCCSCSGTSRKFLLSAWMLSISLQPETLWQ